jgi:hypothetical protein
MAIERYTGDGGTAGMMTKLQEVYEFKKVTESSENRFQLYITDEIFIDYYATNGWADVNTTNKAVTSFIVQQTDDNRTWRIYKTSHGVAFGIDGTALTFISDVVDANGQTTVGVIVCVRNSAYSYYMYFDGMGSSTLSMPTLGNESVYFTAMINAVHGKNSVYFPYLKNLVYSPITKDYFEQKMVVDGTTYLANKYFALEE